MTFKNMENTSGFSCVHSPLIYLIFNIQCLLSGLKDLLSCPLENEILFQAVDTPGTVNSTMYWHVTPEQGGEKCSYNRLLLPAPFQIHEDTLLAVNTVWKPVLK